MLAQTSRTERTEQSASLTVERPRRASPTVLFSQPVPASKIELSAGETLRVLARAAGTIARQQKRTAALAFWSKAIRDPRAIADWINFIVAHHAIHDVAPPNPRTLRKPQRNYGRLGLNVRHRVNALMSHYRFVAAHLPKTMHRSLLDLQPIALGRLVARDTTFELWLGSSLPFGQKQEGELTVWLTNSDGLSLARAAFSFGQDERGAPSLLIGGLQGLTAHADKKIIVVATRKLSGFRPKDAVLVGVQGLAQALGIQNLYAVANTTHVLAAEWFMSGSVISRDYDSFWTERGGNPEPIIGFRLPLPDYAARVAAVATPRLVDKHRAALSAQVKTRMTSI